MRKPQPHVAADGTQSWYVRFRHGVSRKTGKPSQTSERFETLAEAERFARLLDDVGPQAALDLIYNESRGEDVPTLDEYAEKHIASLTRITEGTRTTYRRLYARTWAEPLGRRRLDLIDRHDIAAIINSLVTAGKSDKTIANAHGLLAGIMNGAVIDGHAQRSPCMGVRLPRSSEHTKTEHRYLSHAEFHVLRAAIAPHFLPLLDTLAGTGMRWGEAEALQVKSFDPRAANIKITRAAKWNAGKSVREFGPPKTPKSRRTISLPPEVVAALLPLTEGKHRDDLLFTMPRGGQLRHATFHHRYWVPAIRAAELDEPRLRIHDLRHSHVAWLLSSGEVHLPVIQARLGHESITTTVDTYGHLLPETQAAAASAASLVFGGTAFPTAARELGQV